MGSGAYGPSGSRAEPWPSSPSLPFPSTRPGPIEKQPHRETDAGGDFLFIQGLAGQDDTRGAADHKAEEGGGGAAGFGEVELAAGGGAGEQIAEEVDGWGGAFLERRVEELREAVGLGVEDALQLGGDGGGQ